jgi:hypothetical protein
MVRKGEISKLIKHQFVRDAIAYQLKATQKED